MAFDCCLLSLSGFNEGSFIYFLWARFSFATHKEVGLRMLLTDQSYWLSNCPEDVLERPENIMFVCAGAVFTAFQTNR